MEDLQKKYLLKKERVEKAELKMSRRTNQNREEQKKI